MELKWQRVHSIDELEVGDIIRMDPECNCCYYFSYFDKELERPIDYNNLIIVIERVIPKDPTDEYSYSIIQYYKVVTFVNDKPIYKETTANYINIFDADMLHISEEVEFHLERLVSKGNTKTIIDDNRDEIDLLLDCIFN